MQNFQLHTHPVSRTITMILLLTLGGFGVHSFYMNQINRGILYLLAFTVGSFLVIPPFIAAIFLYIEFYQILTQTDEEFTKSRGLKYMPENKNNIVAGVIALFFGIFGLHFSYLNQKTAAKNRFLIAIVPAIIFFLTFIFSLIFQILLHTASVFDFYGVAFSLISLESGFAIPLFLVISAAGLIYFVLFILSIIEGCRYLIHGAPVEKKTEIVVDPVK